MTTLRYPEKDLRQDEDLEVYFLMRKTGKPEWQVRDMLGLRDINSIAGAYMEELMAIQILPSYLDGYQ